MDNNSIYTQEEQDLLKLSQTTRKKIIEDMTKNGIPSYKEVEVLNQVLASLDKSVNDAATIRQKHQDSNARAETIASVVEILKQVKEQNALVAGRENLDDVELDIEFIPVDIVPGEQDMDQRQLTLDEMMEEEEK